MVGKDKFGKLLDQREEESQPIRRGRGVILSTELNDNTVKQQDGNIDSPQEDIINLQQIDNTVLQQNDATVLSYEDLDEKITFYVPFVLSAKLDDIAIAYKKKHGVRINRNDIVRHLLETADEQTLLSSVIKRAPRKTRGIK